MWGEKCGDYKCGHRRDVHWFSHSSLVSAAYKWKTSRLSPVYPGLPPHRYLRPPSVLPFSISSFWASPILMPLKPTSSSHRVPVEEVSEALDQRTGSDLRSPRDLEGRSSAIERPRLRHRPPYARRSPGRTAPCHQSQAVPAAALPLSKRQSSYTQNRSSLEPLPALQRHRPPTARPPLPSSWEAPREVKSGRGRAPP